MPLVCECLLCAGIIINISLSSRLLGREDAEASWQINALKSSWVISCIKVGLKTDVSENCSLSIIRVEVYCPLFSSTDLCVLCWCKSEEFLKFIETIFDFIFSQQ
jgi:hypothetical protein